MFWIAFSLGLFVGTALGLFTAGLCAMAARRDHRIERVMDQVAYAGTKEPCGERCFSAPV